MVISVLKNDGYYITINVKVIPAHKRVIIYDSDFKPEMK
jgi:hypothetical protein